MLRRMVFWSSKHRSSCSMSKVQRERFMDYFKNNKDTFEKALASKSLEYSVAFGQNASLYLNNDRGLYRSIKRSFMMNIDQLTPDTALRMVEIMKNFQFDGNQEAIIMEIRAYLEKQSVPDETQKRLADLLYFFRPERSMHTNPPKKLSSDNSQKETQDTSIKTTLLHEKLGRKKIVITDPVSSKKLTLIAFRSDKKYGLDSDTINKQLQKAEAVILQLVPNDKDLAIFPGEQTKMSAIQKKQKLVEQNLQEISTWSNPTNLLQQSLNNQAILTPSQIKPYLNKFEDTRLKLYEKNKRQAGYRGLLNFLNQITELVLLADLPVTQEVHQLASITPLKHLRAIFTLARQFYLNEQGRYVLEKVKKGCAKCQGQAHLQSPFEVVDKRHFPLGLKDKAISKNIYNFMKATPYKQYVSFLDEQHLQPVFKRILKMHSKQDSLKNSEKLNIKILNQIGKKNSKQIVSNSKVSQEEAENKDILIAKIAMLSSLYMRKVQLPGDLKLDPESNTLYEKLYDAYIESLHPVQIQCQ